MHRVAAIGISQLIAQNASTGLIILARGMRRCCLSVRVTTSGVLPQAKPDCIIRGDMGLCAAPVPPSSSCGHDNPQPRAVFTSTMAEDRGVTSEAARDGWRSSVTRVHRAIRGLRNGDRDALSAQ